MQHGLPMLEFEFLHHESARRRANVDSIDGMLRIDLRSRVSGTNFAPNQVSRLELLSHHCWSQLKIQAGYGRARHHDIQGFGACGLIESQRISGLGRYLNRMEGLQLIVLAGLGKQISAVARSTA